MLTGVLLLLCAPAPVFDAFDGPLDVRRWYVGVPAPPAKGRLKIPRDGWIVSRGVDDGRVQAVEVVFRHKGGALELTFHGAREPLANPLGEPVAVPKGKGERVLRVARDGATIDGVALRWSGEMRGTFRIRAHRGALEVDEVRVDPRVGEPREWTYLEKRTVLATTTPSLHEGHARATLTLWDAEVCFLLKRGPPAVAPLKAPPKGAPVLAALVTAGEVDALAMRLAAHPAAAREFGDERGNLSRGAYLRYVKETCATLVLLRDAQRAMNLAAPDRDDLEPLAALAAIRHATEARAAFALAEVTGAKKAVAALKKALGKTDPARASGDALRRAAGEAARVILGDAPPPWPGFTFEPQSRFTTVEQAKELAR